MAIERQSPDAILEIANLTPTDVTYIDEDPDAPDALWLTAVSNNANSICRTSFPTPTGNPSSAQEFKGWVRKMGGTGTPTARLDIYENGLLLVSGVDVDITSLTGQLITSSWDASILGTPDGSLVECKLVGTKVGGAPTARATVEYGAVEWNVQYSAGTAHELAGTALLSVDSSGDLTVTLGGIIHLLDGTALLEIESQAGLAVGFILGGSADLTIATNGIISYTAGLVGIADLIIATDGTIVYTAGLAGSSDLVVSTTGDLTVVAGGIAYSLEGNALLSVDSQGVILYTAGLVATADLVLSAQGDLTVVSDQIAHLLEGSALLSIDASGTLAGGAVLKMWNGTQWIIVGG